MRGIKKAILIVSQVLGLLFGDNFDTPVSAVIKEYPDRYPHIF